MKLASSIRYGGELIESINVNHSDYKRLGLICPECKSAVFLRQKSERAAAHFAHFKAADPALVKQCELRVSTYTEKELEGKARQAKHQRLKILQRWFWDIYFKHAFRDGKTKDGIVKGKLIEKIIEGYQVNEYCQIFREIVASSAAQKVIDEAIIAASPDGLKSERIKYLREKVVNSEVELHKLICSEIIEFLKVKRNLPLLEKVISASLLMCELSPSAKAQMASGDWQAPIRSAVVVLCMVPWGEEFQALDAIKKPN